MRPAILLAIAAAPLLAQQKQQLTLREAEQISLKNHPAIASANFMALAAAEVPVQQAAARLPVLTGSFTGVGAPENSRLAAGGINNPIIYSRLASGVSVSQLALDFGRTSHLIESSRYQARAEDENVNAARGRIILEVNRAYFDALRAEAVLKVARSTVESRRLVLDQVTELFRARLKSELDVSFAAVNLEEARLLVTTAENERRAALANLAAAMGYQTVSDYELVDEPFQIEPLVASELIAEAMRRRPELRALNLRAEAASRFASAEKALRYPSVSLVGSAGLAPQRSSALRSNYAAAGVNITLPFLNGGLLRAREAEAELRARGSREQAREMETRIVRDIHVALLNVNTAAEQVGLTARLYDQATKAAELAQARYDLGLSSIVELSQTQLSQTSALIQNTNAKYNYQTHRAVLDFHIGARP